MDKLTRIKGKSSALLWQGCWMTAIALTLRWLGLRFGTLIAARVGTDVVGLTSLAGGTVGFAITLCSAGVGLGCTQLVSEGLGRDDAFFVRRSLAAALRYSLLLGLATAVGLYLLADPIARLILKDTRTTAYLRLHALTLPAVSLSGCIAGYLASLKEAPLGALVRTLGEFARMGLLLVYFDRGTDFAAGDAIRPLLLLSVCDLLTEWGILFATLFLLLFIARKKHKKGVFSPGLPFGCKRDADGRAVWRRYLQTVVPLAVSACFRSALLYAEHLLIPNTLVRYGLTRKEALGAFGLLHGMVFPFVLLPSAAVASFGGLLIPEVAESRARGDEEHVRALAHKALSLTLCFSVGVAGCLFIGAEDCAFLLFRDEEAGVQIRILALLVPVMYCDTMTDVFLKGFGEHVYSMKVNIFDALAALVLVALTVPRFGIYGYLAGVWFTETFNLILSFARLRRYVPFPARSAAAVILPLGTVFAVCALFFRILPAPDSTLALYLQMGLPFLCYVAVLAFPRLFRKARRTVIG